MSTRKHRGRGAGEMKTRGKIDATYRGQLLANPGHLVAAWPGRSGEGE